MNVNRLMALSAQPLDVLWRVVVSVFVPVVTLHPLSFRAMAATARAMLRRIWIHRVCSLTPSIWRGLVAFVGWIFITGQICSAFGLGSWKRLGGISLPCHESGSFEPELKSDSVDTKFIGYVVQAVSQIVSSLDPNQFSIRQFAPLGVLHLFILSH